MKLHFNKTTEGDVQVKMEKGTVLSEFDYIEMLKQLSQNNQIDSDWGNLEDNERNKIEELLEKIKNAVKSGMEILRHFFRSKDPDRSYRKRPFFSSAKGIVDYHRDLFYRQAYVCLEGCTCTEGMDSRICPAAAVESNLPLKKP